MKTPQVTPFGSWKSPITSDLIVSQTIGIGSIAINSEHIYWLEKRPQEQGRNLIVGHFNQGETKNITPSPLSVRSKIHEYGGGAFAVEQNTVYFSNYKDGRIYQQIIGQQPNLLTHNLHQRYGDIIVDHGRERLICVCEDHQTDGEAKNSIVTIEISTGKIQDLISGDDFYSSWLAKLKDDGSIFEPELIAGGKAESICEVKWGGDGTLYFSSDRTNWWNLYRRKLDGAVEILHQKSAEFAYPHWVFGLSTFALVGNDRLICAYSAEGCWHLGEIDLQTKKFQEIKTKYTNISDLQGSNQGYVVFIGGAPTETTAVIKLDLETGKEEILKRTGELEIDPGYLSVPEAIAFPTSNNLTAYAWYYPPQNQDYQALERELPPLIVKSHGGPTAAASVNLNLRIQYWTSRGFGYLDVNYGGSIGYGREYRQRLDGNWGIVDVDDYYGK